jgi:phosphoribosylformylglycinamidine synthase
MTLAQTIKTDVQTKCKHYRLSLEEYKKACELVGHELTEIEWPLFSALWSEHCSYKSSKNHLRKFYNKNSRVLESEGENAGVVDLGFGERVAFKMESHNHPSFIEPYQGAATGVGGILRDIFTMGARPIALADYLCFGEPTALRMNVLVDGVVRGIGGYGNCVGVPTVTGQTNFHPSYNNNILVNAMAVGLFRKDEKIALSAAQGVGNFVVYVGAKTGKDGVHGASMASEAFDDDNEKKKPNVQIGDPYFEKLLIESCLEVIQKDLVVSIQDMGAAGLTSSSFEMASKGKVGMKIHLDKVPLRDSTTTPEEILLSESQERMLMVVLPKNLKAVEEVFLHWGLDAVCIGEVIAEQKVQLFWKGDQLVNIDPDLLVEHAPRYERPYQVWTPKNKVVNKNIESKDFEIRAGTTDQMNRDFIYRQYDQRVGAMTAHDCTSPVAIQRLPDSGRGLGIAVGCRPELMKMDAEIGAFDAVVYPALQLAAQGCETVAVTDCLNFGNPEKPEIMSEFVVSVESISKICKALDAPVVSGNVSFYNETLGQNITSTPATGLIGLRPNVKNLKSDFFVNEDEKVFVLRLDQVTIFNIFSANDAKFTGDFDPKVVSDFIRLVRELSLREEVSTMKVVGLGGLGSALVKCAAGNMGVRMLSSSTDFNLSDFNLSFLYEVVFSLKKDSEAKTIEWLKKWNANFTKVIELGVTQKGFIEMGSFKWNVSELLEANQSAWRRSFEELA